MISLKELAKKEDLFVSGHEMCPGCGIPVILKIVLRTTKCNEFVFDAAHPIIIDLFNDEFALEMRQ